MKSEQTIDSRKLKVLDRIQASMGADIEEMNAIIRRELHTDHELVNRIVDNYLRTKGKQIRPILVMLAAKMFGELGPKVLFAAASLEMLHNATLIHDDVVDQTPVRRGRPTINAIWDNHLAVLSGDIFVSKALTAGIRTGSLDILESLSALGTELSLGEMDQLFNARNHDFNDKAYFSMIGRKTASLFRGCVRIGCQAVEAPADKRRVLEDYAYIMGMAFQIRDDVFDYFPSDDIGKPSGHDLLEGKVTLPLLHALATAPQGESEWAVKILASDEELTPEAIRRLQEFAISRGGIEAAYAKMNEYKEEGKKLLRELPANESRRCFEEIFDYIIDRTH